MNFTFKYPDKIKLIAYCLLICIFFACAQRGLLSDDYPDIAGTPKLPPDEYYNENPTFITFGDSRPGWRALEKFLKPDNWFTWKMLLFPFYEIYWIWNGFIGGIEALRGDTEFGKKERILVRQAIYNEAKRSGADFLLSSEFVYDGRYPHEWLRFLKEIEEHPLLNEIPLLPVIGNHDFYGDTEFGKRNYEYVFDYPPFYTLEFPDMVLIVVNSGILLDQNQLIDDDEQDALFSRWYVSDDGNPEKSWLENVLINTDKTFTILSMHHTLISSGIHHSDWDNTDNGRNLHEKRQKLIALLKEYGVQLILSGHEHHYEHYVLNYQKEGKQEMHFVVGGGGGVPLRNIPDQTVIDRYLIEYSNNGFDVEQVKLEKIFNYSLVEVEAERVTVKTYRVPISGENAVILVEEFIINK